LNSPVGNQAVTSGLLFVVADKGIVEQLAIYQLNIFVAIGDVEAGTLWVSIGCMEGAAVVTDRTFPHHNADGSFHAGHPPSLFGWCPAIAGVLLLFPKVTQKHF